MALNENQKHLQNTAVAALEKLLADFPSNTGLPENVKKAREYCKAAEGVGDTTSETYKKQKAIAAFKPTASSETRVQIVDSLRFAKRIGIPAVKRD